MKDKNEKKYLQANTLTSLPIDIKTIKRYYKNKTEFYNYAVAFDIETSSFRTNSDEPRACMYIWQMCFGDSDFLVYGRTWEEFKEFIRLVRKHFHLKKSRVLVVYVHNLSYEAQFIRKFFEWEKVFALEKRVPLYMRTKFGIEFRCSYKLSNYSLETLAKNLLHHDLKKLVGNLDYKKIRHSSTPLTDEEIDYAMYDVRIVCAYISERLEIDGNITKIPLTQTGYVRTAFKSACFGDDHDEPKYYNYRNEMKRLTMEVDEYEMLRNAFMGGYTHANCYYVDKTLTNVISQDFTSSYPYVLLSEMYPWTKGELCHPSYDELKDKLNLYGWIIEVEFERIESKIMQDDFISYSRCGFCLGGRLNNGRVNYADRLGITVTSVDFEIIEKCYRWKSVKIKRAYRYGLKYLPTDFIDELLFYYEQKTTLKNVAGKEEEYQTAKGRCNSAYGMIVTNPLRPVIKYENDEWISEEVDLFEGIAKYNKNPNRFMPYVVGVFVTAYARRNLWTGILAVGDDYVYADTDSIKLLNYEDHKPYFDWYNKRVFEKLQRACDYHGFDISRAMPKTIKGIEKPLGIWDFDGKYSRFKTLGAKRYLYEYESGELSLTVSGLNKKGAIPYLLETYGKDKIFEIFTDVRIEDLTQDPFIIPKGKSGRLISTYIDDETFGKVIDYMGNVGSYHEMSSINLEESTYSLSLAKDYLMYLLGIRKEVFGNEIK